MKRAAEMIGGPLNFGGAKRNRTADLLIANEALYQLSYGPRKARNKLFRSAPVKRLFRLTLPLGADAG